MPTILLKCSNIAMAAIHTAMIINYPDVDSFYRFIIARTILLCIMNSFYMNPIELLKFPSIALECIIIDFIFIIRMNIVNPAGYILLASTVWHIISDKLSTDDINPWAELSRVYAYVFLIIARLMLISTF